MLSLAATTIQPDIRSLVSRVTLDIPCDTRLVIEPSTSVSSPSLGGKIYVGHMLRNQTTLSWNNKVEEAEAKGVN